MLVPPIGKHGAVHYWLSAYGREIPYENAYESSPDGDQAIMFHGTNLDDLWRHGCNGKISRAMPDEAAERGMGGAWHSIPGLRPMELPGQGLDGESRIDCRQESNQPRHASHY